MIKNRTGIATTTIHAPCVNLVVSTSTNTMPVIVQPTALTTRLRRMVLRSAADNSGLRNRRVQWRTIPVWLIVKETNTPMM